MAGTGKTFFTNKLINGLQEAGKKIKCLAPTNEAARLIGGLTIDKFNNTYRKKKAFKSLKHNYR